MQGSPQKNIAVLLGFFEDIVGNGGNQTADDPVDDVGDGHDDHGIVGVDAHSGKTDEFGKDDIIGAGHHNVTDLMAQKAAGMGKDLFPGELIQLLLVLKDGIVFSGDPEAEEPVQQQATEDAAGKHQHIIFGDPQHKDLYRVIHHLQQACE